MLVKRPGQPLWGCEACDRYFDPLSGAKVIQLTSSPQCSINIYCEQPYASPDGRRFAFVRRADTASVENTLMVADLHKLYVTIIDTHVIGVFNAAWSGIVFYYTSDAKLKKVDLTTLQVTHVDLGFDPQLAGRAASVSPDQNLIACHQPLRDTHAIKCINLREKSASLIYQHPHMCNPHLQFNPIHGRQILLQLNRGSITTGDKTTELRDNRVAGVTHFLINSDGTNPQPLPFGPPLSASSTGHSNWIADTGAVAFTTAWNQSDVFNFQHDPRNPDGNILWGSPADSKPHVFHAPDIFSTHINVSRCGRFFVVDAYESSLYDQNKRIKSGAIVIGCFATGKRRTLVADTLTSGGGGEHSHIHPYLTADNKHVIYNSNPYYSTTQVFAAKIPEDFLPSLL
jgi:hypothetical protein